MASKEFQIGDTKHLEMVQEWSACFEIPPFGREAALGYETEVDDLVVTLRSILEQQETQVPFRSVRGVQSGIALFGAPGVGKTHLLRAAAGTVKVPLLVAKFASVVGVYLGETARRMAALVDAGQEVARQHGGAIILFDEIDCYGRRNGNPDAQAYTVMITNLLTLMDKAASDTSGPRLAIVAASNYPSLCDPALLSRFSKRVEISAPRPEQRKAFLEASIAEAQLAGYLPRTLDVDPFVRITEGLNMRDLCQILEDSNARTLAATRENRRPTEDEIVGWLLEGARRRQSSAVRSLVPETDPAFG